MSHTNEATPNLSATAGTTPSDQARNRPFKLRLSRAGVDIGGEWLCRLTGAALAYQSYCGTHGTPRVFRWVHIGDKAYLQDQEGNWLSHEYWTDCLYMSYKMNAVAWRLENGRLIRDNDGAVVTLRMSKRWTFANEKFLSAEKASDEALTVEVVEEPLTAVEKLTDFMTPVYAKRHPVDGVDRYLYTTSTVGQPAIPERKAYAGHDVAFFGLKRQAEDDPAVPVYLLRMYSEEEKRAYFKLSLATEEAGYTAEAGASPNFYAYASDVTHTFLTQVYEHAADNPTAGQRRFTYDFEAGAHSGWSAGVPVFRALSLAEAEKALVGSLGAESARRYATEWIRENGDKMAKLLQGLGKDNLNRDVVEQFHKLFEGLPSPRYMTLGAGFHGGYGLGTAGVEFGAIWRADDFGHVPVHEPLSDYSVEWVTFGGATGLDIGASVDALAIGTWFGEISQIEGACNGVTLTAQVGGGISVTLLWDGTWQGANYSAHPIGMTAIAAIGPEIGAGIFYNASATQFWNRRPDFPSR